MAAEPPRADVATAFAKSVYHALFVDDINIAEPAEISKLAEPLGVDVHAMDAGATSYQIKDQLKAEIEVAMAKGVFGSPFVIIDGERSGASTVSTRSKTT